MASTPRCTCICDSADSALSTTSSIISVITLVYVVIIGVVYQVAVRRRAKNHTSTLFTEARNLRTKIDTIRASNSQQPSPDDFPVASLLDTANDQLHRLERSLSIGREDTPGEKWYLIWRQIDYARKRESAERSLTTIQSRVQFYENYRTLVTLVQDRNVAETPAERHQRRLLRTLVLLQAEELPDVIVPQEIQENTEPNQPEPHRQDSADWDV
ncbi:hypothetical protein BKA66DRAFT_475517 [Pyrenochaeta sp. MPI-SDFR-AT-0127]|nr:hypothetical protein BKA66DRAFT_475517 [Pyrenochaeta sp. MPI-SDFR-AT-0127]